MKARDLLLQKGNNCVTHLATLGPFQEEPALVNEMKELLESPEVFLAWINQYLIPVKKDLPAQIKTMLESHSLQIEQFKQPDVDKLQAYLQCFIDIAERIAQ